MACAGGTTQPATPRRLPYGASRLTALARQLPDPRRTASSCCPDAFPLPSGWKVSVGFLTSTYPSRDVPMGRCQQGLPAHLEQLLRSRPAKAYCSGMACLDGRAAENHLRARWRDPDQLPRAQAQDSSRSRGIQNAPRFRSVERLGSDLPQSDLTAVLQPRR